MDWNQIKTEYITSDVSYRNLCEKYGVGRSSLGERASKEGWKRLRDEFRDKTVTKAVQKNGQLMIKRVKRIHAIADRLLEKIETAVDEIDLHYETNVTKTKTIEYNNDARPDKPTKEVVEEHIEVSEIRSVVDKAGLRQITAAMRDIMEIQGIRTELDREEQQARIESLRAQTARAASGMPDETETGVVMIPLVEKETDSCNE